MIAFLGLGRMGAPMARRLIPAGHDLTVWNRTPGRADVPGATVASSPADAAGPADVVISMLSDPAAVEAVYAEAGPALRPGTLVLEMSTIGPEAVNSLRASLPPEVELVDAPVLGSVEPAASGELIVMAGGSPGTLDRAEPLLSVFGKVTRTGPVGSAATTKVAVMSVLVPLRVSLAETLTGFGEVDNEVLLDLLDAALARTARRQLGDPDGPVRYSLSHAAKDLGLAQGRSLTIAEAALRRFQAAERDGLGALNHTAVVRHIARGE